MNCSHPSWKPAGNGKDACELCGAVGTEMRYLQPDGESARLSATLTPSSAVRLLEEAYRKNCRTCNGDSWTCRNIGIGFEEPCVAYNVRKELSGANVDGSAKEPK